MRQSALEEIHGVGPARRQALMGHFKTVKAIREATLEQLESVVPRNAAQAVYDHFRKEEQGHG